MLRSLVPPPAAAVEHFGDVTGSMYRQEWVAVALAGPARRREFVTGRVCARAALARLGIHDCPVPAGTCGEPLWPDGVIGSITHCAGYRAAIVARRSRVALIGIDAEVHAPLPMNLLDAVATREERTQVAALMRSWPAVAWDRMLVSMKEAAFKAWFPAIGPELGFDQVHVTINAPRKLFSARLVASAAVGAPTALAGRFDATEALLVAMCVPSEDS